MEQQHNNDVFNQECHFESIGTNGGLYSLEELRSWTIDLIYRPLDEIAKNLEDAHHYSQFDFAGTLSLVWITQDQLRIMLRTLEKIMKEWPTSPADSVAASGGNHQNRLAGVNEARKEGVHEPTC